MSILENHLQFVNEQLAFQQKMLEKLVLLKDSPAKQKFHKALVDKFEALRIYLMQIKNVELDVTGYPNRPPKLSLTPRDIQGLPDELLKELSIGEDNTEFAILKVLEDYGGIASLDQLLVGIYRKTGEVLKRQALTSRLYRMAQKELVYSVSGKKGVYSNRNIEAEETAKLFEDEPTPT